ncbi:MAG: succinate dehydrogenase assembly factor 2 [Gammaproteobacteria bacterium]|nr:succinate dehydrogenase assembly factor 2 [Gammaproteobacteria bacterium]
MNTARSDEEGLSRLHWCCRRGMLELDLLLTTFMEKEYNSLTKEEMILFSVLLDYQDQALLDLLLAKTEPEDAMILALVKKIRCATQAEFEASSDQRES